MQEINANMLENLHSQTRYVKTNNVKTAHTGLANLHIVALRDKSSHMAKGRLDRRQRPALLWIARSATDRLHVADKAERKRAEVGQAENALRG